MVGLWTTKEFIGLLACFLLEVIGIALVASAASVVLGAVLVLLAAISQIVIALKFRARRRSRAVWRTNNP